MIACRPGLVAIFDNTPVTLRLRQVDVRLWEHAIECVFYGRKLHWPYTGVDALHAKWRWTRPSTNDRYNGMNDERGYCMGCQEELCHLDDSANGAHNATCAKC